MSNTKTKLTYESGQEVTIMTIKTLEDINLGYEPSFYAVLPGYTRGTNIDMICTFVDAAKITIKKYLDSKREEDPSFTKEMADAEYKTVTRNGDYFQTYTHHKYAYQIETNSANLA